jgi:hypothetical protein
MADTLLCIADDCSKPSTKALARQIQSKFYFTGLTCVNGHVADRRTTTGQCLGCERRSNHEMYAAHKGERSARSRSDYTKARAHRIRRAQKWQTENADRKKEIDAAAKIRNRVRNRELGRLKRLRNPEREREYVRDWLRNNRHRVAELVKFRKLAKIKACPPWLTKEHRKQIARLYSEAQRLTNETGVPHHVDHFYPLRGKNFCGLHVPWNLRVITGLENLRKGASAPAGEPVFD